MRYLTEAEIGQVFGADRPDGLTASRYCARVNYRFGDTIAYPERTWLLFPEIPYHQENGNDKFARLLSQSKTYGVRTACIFYDLIPVRDPDYMAHKSAHLEYLLEMLRCDRIFAISRFAGKDLVNFYSSILQPEQAADIARAVTAVPLGEHFAPSFEIPLGLDNDGVDRIVLLGTVEPRKQQTRFLRIFNDLQTSESTLRDYSVEIFGSLHPACADELNVELRRNTRITYHSYASDQEVKNALGRARFSVFISRSEGYGLPIVESLQLGVPCLTSSFDAMAEVAEGGGCLVVDSRSDAAIADGILKLVRHPEVLTQLRSEARKRKRRTWTDYASDLLKCMPAGAGELPKGSIAALLAGNAVVINGIAWSTITASGLDVENNSTQRPDHRTLGVVDWTTADLGTVSNKALATLCDADILAFLDSTVMVAFPELLRVREVSALPSAHIGVLTTDASVVSWLDRSILDLSLHSHRLTSMAKQEGMLGYGARILAPELSNPFPHLAIVISTYNRARFCELNVAWLLEKVQKYGSRVQVVVVDNASTDDTEARLGAFRNNRSFTLLVNPSNTGMLGNLHVCSILQVARHVWLIGDDDFIHDHAIESVLALLDVNPRIPLISTNFAVYYRKNIADGDDGERYVREGQDMAPDAPPSGSTKLIRIAEYHDNVFTAIYPLIFRADLLAACFNYMFDGEPFQDLTQSVPTTKFILEFLALCDGHWLKKPGITGNAHNSWTRFRPRWHSVLIPQILQLARDSGLPSQVAWRWLKVHGPLFDEAISEAAANGLLVNLSTVEIEQASWMFRNKLSLPATVKTCEVARPPLFSRN